MKAKRTVITFGDMRVGKDSNRSKRTPTVRKIKSAIADVDRIKVPDMGRPRVETGNAAVADLGAPAAARPTLAEQAALDRIDLTVDLAPEHGGLMLQNPIMVASGTFGYGVEYGEVVDVQRIGAICCKGTTLRPRAGNQPPRVTETPGGMLNSIGLQNPGVDAVIVQDFGVARLVKRWVPSLRLHASTQMTCTDAASLKWAAELGAVRVTLARELSLGEARELASEAAMELEIFVHGALCVSYSGQCLTSEAIGGRSANRGACAQACRLPFDLMLDGVHKELGDKSYLLSPKDLDASRSIPEIVESGVRAIKIEGRLKDRAYVANVVSFYRAQLDAVLAERGMPRASGGTARSYHDLSAASAGCSRSPPRYDHTLGK